MHTPLLATFALTATLVPAIAQMGAGHQPRDAFSNFDRDRDGYISPTEARKADILDRIDQMDRDGDGLVSEREFNAMDAPGIATDQVRSHSGEDRRPPFERSE